MKLKALSMSVAAVGVIALGPAGPASQAASSTLYVAVNGSDSNSGTASLPFRTIGRAAQAAGPGTTVNVAPGTYTSPITTSVSGTSSARVAFVSTTRGAARIQTSGAWRAWLNYGSYVDIQGFDISAPDAHGGIQNEGSYVRILANEVHNVASHINDNGCDSNGGSGIVSGNYSAGYNEVNGNLVHDIGNYENPAVPTSCWTIHGIYDSEKADKILNNIVYKTEAFGLHLWHASTDTTVSGNISFNNGVGGLQVGDGDSPGGTTADNYVISNNIIMDNPVFGVRGAGSMGSNNKYMNNIIFRNGSTFTQISSGISGTRSVDPQFVNYQLNGFAAGGDYHLKSSSPAIDAGVSQGAPPTDYDGRPRPQGAGVDIGAYEYGSGPAPTPTPSASPTSTPRPTATATSIPAPTRTSTPAPTVVSGVPAVPSGLTAQNVACTTNSNCLWAKLSWKDNSNNETNFELNRSTDQVNWECCWRTPTNVTTFTTGNLASRTLYYFRVRALDAAGASNWSSLATLKTP
jgi:hypothetical protein